METNALLYSEADFVAYAFTHMGIAFTRRDARVFELADGFVVEVESKNLYRLSHEGWVISPFDDIEKLCVFIERNA